MNVKKISIVVVGLMCATCLLAACGNKGKFSDGVKENVKIDKDDAVKTEKKVVDGKEVEEYTMADGTVIQVDNVDEEDSSGSGTSDSSDADTGTSDSK